MKLLSSLCLVIALLSLANKANSQTAFPSSNPFFNESNLPYQTPDFSKIKTSDIKPALEEGMKIQRQEIDKIAGNPQPPTFENTLVALEKSGQLFSRASAVFSLLTGANTNPELQKVRQEIAPAMAAQRDAIFLNGKLFKRVETIYNNSGKLKLDAEAKRLVEVYYQRFLLAGAKLSEADKAVLKKLNEEEASLSARFTNQLLAATKAGAVIANDASVFAGLSQGELDAAARDAKARGYENKWLLPLQNTTQQPPLQSLSNRNTRQQLFESSWNRAVKNDSNDTRATIAAIAKIHAAKAKLLGFKNFAEWKLRDQMAKTPGTVNTFLTDLASPAITKAKTEAADIQALIDKQNGGFQLEPWDWNFYAEQVRKEKYDLDEKEVKPYFELNNVLENGVFYAATLLYGITFKERHDLPVWQEDVRVFELFEQNGTSIGLFYCDYFKRDNKSGGAWMSNLVRQTKLLGTKPVIYNICNFPKPSPGQPALISFDNVTTMFHEFGHALHGFFASQTYPFLSGTSVARDFVEFPSQFNEHWALEPKVLRHYAVHYQTKEPIPQALLDKIKKAANFNGGYDLTELLEAALLDMQWNTIAAGDSVSDAAEFENDFLKTRLASSPVPPRYRSTYFSHIWSSAYAAGYYAYLWTDMLEEDIYSWFLENGGMTRANGQRLRDMILSRGNTIEYGKMFRDFRGHDPEVKPMLKSRGLVSE